MVRHTLKILQQSVSETIATTTTYACANDLNSIKEHISVLNTKITAMRSHMLEWMVILKKSVSPVIDTYSGTKFSMCQLTFRTN